MTVLLVPGTPGTTLYAGLPTPSGDVLLTTLSLVNTSGSTQAANFVSPMFGHPFVEGDLPTGEYPAFTLADDTPVPATVYSDVAWGDDSKKFCGVLLRSPASIAGSGTQTINVKNGGAAPASSSRSLSDLTAADIKVELTGVTNLSGVWTASLNTAITDATDIKVIGDGPAGKVYRIGGPFKQSGSAHGQLYCWHYAAILQDAAGNFMGIRYLGRIAQPFIEVTSPTPAHRIVTAVLKSGVTTIRTLQGHTTTETPGSNILIPHFGSIVTCGATAQWDYIQGGGTAAADCTVRVVPDFEYFSKSQMLVPYAYGTSVTDLASVDYYGHGRGSMVRATGDTGERPEIGVMPSWVASYALNGSAVNERQVRVNAMVTTGWPVGARLSSTLMPPPVTSPSASYTGLGTNQPTWRMGSVGYPTLTGNDSLWLETENGHHRAGATYPAYLFTGEPQYLDLLVEQAANFIATMPPGNGTTWTTTDPVTSARSGAFDNRDPIIDGVTYHGAALMFREDLLRFQAWMLRDVAQASAILPDTCPSGTEIKKYLREVAESNWAAFVAYRNALPADYRDNGIFGLKPSYISLERTWTVGYLSNSFAHQYGITKHANAFTCAQHSANFWSKIEADPELDMAAAASYDLYVFNAAGQRINRVDELFFVPQYCVITYASAGNTITFSGGNDNFGFVNGDSIRGDSAFVSGITTGQKLYFINKSGKSAQLSATPGGSPLTIINGAFYGPGLRIANFAPTLTYEDDLSPQSYLANVTGAIRHLNAIGCTGLTAAVADMDARVVSGAVDYSGVPKNAMASTLPA